MWDEIDRRRGVRVSFPFTIHIYAEHEPAISTYTEDISEGGVKVTIRKELELSSVTNLEIYIKEDPIDCRGVVSWVKRRESNYIEGEVFFDTGMEFEGMKEEYRAMLKEAVKGLEKEENSES